MDRRTRFLALAGVSVFAGSLALTACGLATTARPGSSGFTGYNWQVTAISRDGELTSIPARLGVALQFWGSGQFGASDGVNAHFGTYRMISDGFATSELITTDAGYVGHDPAVLMAIGAIRSFDNGAHATVEATGDRLLVGVDSYTLTCHRLGPEGNFPEPAPTAASSGTTS